MTLNAIICDWNGTIIMQRDESPVFRQVAVDLFKHSVPFHPLCIARLIKTGRELEALYRERRYDAGFDYVLEIFRVYNQKVIKGLPASFVRRSVDRYADRKRTLEKLDRRILRPVAELHRNGVATGILSAGYGYGIQAILKAAGYGDCFDFCKANQLSENHGKALAFELNIYKNKAQFLLNILKERNLDARKLVYIGDSEDDSGCIEVVGHPVVAFFAADKLKQRYAQKFRAFVPADEADLAKYLRSL